MVTSAADAVLLAVARGAIRGTLRDEPLPPLAVEGLADELAAPGGCFVSLHTLGGHRLRGCVGQIESGEPLAVSVRSAAVSVLRDPRFIDRPVTEAELAGLELEISVLSPLEPSRPDAFDLFNDGIVLSVDGRSGCFLPQVARETGWSRDRLLDRLCTEKLGVPAGAWARPDAVLRRFSVRLIGPVPFEAPIGD